MSQSGCVVNIQAENGGRIVTATYVYPYGWMDVQSLQILSGDEMTQWLHAEDVSWVMKCY
jgi:hypothetical protein